MNRRFQFKFAKSKKHAYNKNVAAIPTTFDTVIKTIKNLRGWSEHTHNKSTMADGRHLWKIVNRYISATVWPIATKFSTVTQFDHLHPGTLYGFQLRPQWLCMRKRVTFYFTCTPFKGTHTQISSHTHWLVYAPDAWSSFSKNKFVV